MGHDEERGEREDGWVDWAGGECPVPADTIVSMRYRNGVFGTTRRADECWWGSELGEGYDGSADIVAYRIVAPANERVTPPRQIQSSPITALRQEHRLHALIDPNAAMLARDARTTSAPTAEALAGDGRIFGAPRNYDASDWRQHVMLVADIPATGFSAQWGERS